jgi:MraZ protein
MAFLGTYPYQMDDKNRVPIPPRYRGQFEDGAVLTTGLEPCVVLYTPTGFDEAAARVEAIPEETEEGRDARRDFFANAQPLDKDSQGRLTLQDKWIRHAGLAKEIVVIGTGKCLEIWDRATWETRDTNRVSARRQETQAMARRGSAEERGG